jgi:hypothetical protein
MPGDALSLGLRSDFDALLPLFGNKASKARAFAHFGRMPQSHFTTMGEKRPTMGRNSTIVVVTFLATGIDGAATPAVGDLSQRGRA